MNEFQIEVEIKLDLTEEEVLYERLLKYLLSVQLLVAILLKMMRCIFVNSSHCSCSVWLLAHRHRIDRLIEEAVLVVVLHGQIPINTLSAAEDLLP